MKRQGSGSVSDLKAGSGPVSKGSGSATLTVPGLFTSHGMHTALFSVLRQLQQHIFYMYRLLVCNLVLLSVSQEQQLTTSGLYLYLLRRLVMKENNIFYYISNQSAKCYLLSFFSFCVNSDIIWSSRPPALVGVVCILAVLIILFCSRQFSLIAGCILCELLTGYPLLPGEDEGESTLHVNLFYPPLARLL